MLCPGSASTACTIATAGLTALALTLAVAPPREAAAAEGLYLAWNECRTGSGSVNETFACDQNDVTLELVASFQAPADLSDVIGIEVVVDVQHSTAALPDWWQMGASGCRASELLASSDFSAMADCAVPWGGPASGVIQGYAIGEPRGTPSQVRIKAVGGVLPEDAVTLVDGVHYYGIRIRFRSGMTTGPGGCSGCIPGACLVLNGVVIRRIKGSPGGDVTVVTPGAGNANWATWRGGGADCSLVPARGLTWGAIKSFYR